MAPWNSAVSLTMMVTIWPLETMLRVLKSATSGIGVVEAPGLSLAVQVPHAHQAVAQAGEHVSGVAADCGSADFPGMW